MPMRTCCLCLRPVPVAPGYRHVLVSHVCMDGARDDIRRTSIVTDRMTREDNLNRLLEV